MWAMPAMSFPRRSPGWPFVSTQTTYLAGFASIVLSAFAVTALQLRFGRERATS